MTDMELYQNSLSKLAYTDSTLSSGNYRANHAKIAIYEILSKAILKRSNNLRIIAGTLSEETFDLKLIKTYINSLKNDGQTPDIKICLTDVHRLNDANSIVKSLHEMESVSIKHTRLDKIDHFLTVGNSYRFELDTSTLEGDVCFNDTDFSTTLRDIFDSIFENKADYLN